jgi:hypothetical protein
VWQYFMAETACRSKRCCWHNLSRVMNRSMLPWGTLLPVPIISGPFGKGERERRGLCPCQAPATPNSVSFHSCTYISSFLQNIFYIASTRITGDYCIQCLNWSTPTTFHTRRGL